MVALSACSTDNTYLPALLDDPMASYQADGIVLVEAWEQAEGTEWLSGKPVHAKVERTYRFTDRSQLERILEEMVAFAESVDWRVSEPLVASQAFEGSKELPSGSGRLWVGLDQGDPDSDGPGLLRITLDYGPVRSPNTTPTSEAR